METTAQVLYTQTYGTMNEESDNPHGVQVSLSYWSSREYVLPSHYVLHSQMMVDRDLVTDSYKVRINRGWQAHAEEIRNAITVFDLMCANLDELTKALHEVAK